MIANRKRRSFAASVEEMEPRHLLSATYTVTNLYGYYGQGSLRWAIQSSNQTPSTPQAPNVINFAPSIAGLTIPNTSGPMTITTSVYIEGSSQVLTGSGNSQMFVTTGSNTVVDFFNLSMVHCRADGNASLGNYTVGGAILCIGAGVGLYGDYFQDDTAAYAGGAVYAYSGGVWVGTSTFTQNYAGTYAGAIGCYYATPLIFTGPTSLVFTNVAGVNGGGVQVQNGYYSVLGLFVYYNNNKPNDIFLY